MSHFEDPDLIKKWCQTHEPANENCIQEWRAICARSGQEDPSCYATCFQLFRNSVTTINFSRMILLFSGLLFTKSGLGCGQLNIGMEGFKFLSFLSAAWLFYLPRLLLVIFAAISIDISTGRFLSQCPQILLVGYGSRFQCTKGQYSREQIYPAEYLPLESIQTCSLLFHLDYL